MSGGTHGTLATIEIGQKVPASSDAYSAYDRQVGSEIEDKNGKRYRFVRLNQANGRASCGKRTFFYTSNNQLYDVDYTTSDDDQCCGVSVEGQVDLDDNDLFWLQIDGRVTLTNSDDATDVALGDLLRCSGDTDLGKVEVDASPRFDTSHFRARQAQTTTDGDIVADCIRCLRG